MAKGQRAQGQTMIYNTIHYTEKKRSSNTNPTKNRGGGGGGVNSAAPKG